MDMAAATVAMAGANVNGATVKCAMKHGASSNGTTTMGIVAIDIERHFPS